MYVMWITEYHLGNTIDMKKGNKTEEQVSDADSFLRTSVTRRSDSVRETKPTAFVVIQGCLTV